MLKRRGIILISLLLCLAVILSACGVKVAGKSNYQRMYTVIDDWNKHATKGFERENLFGYGEYLYNSYLLLFPRETPSTLTDFYFQWVPVIDVDDYSAYFTCQLDSESYDAFVSRLNRFTVTKDNETRKLLRDDSHFDYPAYIIQWLSPGEKWEVLEYILADDDHHTLIFVYATLCGLDRIKDYASYQICPNTDVTNVVSNSYYNFDDGQDGNMGWSEGFSVYFADMEGAKYDVSFLSLLSNESSLAK